MEDDLALYADFEDIWVVYYLTGEGVRAVQSECYSKEAALRSLKLLEDSGVECVLGRTIRFINTDE